MFFEGWSWFKLNNLGLALDMALKFYISSAKGFKLKVRRFCGLIGLFVEVTGGKLVGGLLGPPILNRVKAQLFLSTKNTAVIINQSYYYGIFILKV